MKSPHGIPIVGEEVLVVVAVAFFDEDAGLYPLSVARSKVAALVHVSLAKRFARQPDVARAFDDYLACFRAYLFPGFLEDHHMDDKALSLIWAVLILDVVYPLELLPSTIAPLHRKAVVLFELL